MTIQTIIDIRVIPRSSRHDIILAPDGSIRVYLNSPPAEGRANTECIELFSTRLKLAKSSISIIKGEHGKLKRLVIKGIDKNSFFEKLQKSHL